MDRTKIQKSIASQLKMRVIKLPLVIKNIDLKLIILLFLLINPIDYNLHFYLKYCMIFSFS